jgi:hypothetical protein
MKLNKKDHALKNIIIIVVLVIFISIFIELCGCSRNVDDVKANAGETFLNNGFVVVGYHGYELSLIYGGIVWYTLEKGGGVTYQAAIVKWFDEYHIYCLEAIDALKPSK